MWIYHKIPSSFSNFSVWSPLNFDLAPHLTFQCCHPSQCTQLWGFQGRIYSACSYWRFNIQTQSPRVGYLFLWTSNSEPVMLDAYPSSPNKNTYLATPRTNYCCHKTYRWHQSESIRADSSQFKMCPGSQELALFWRYHYQGCWSLLSCWSSTHKSAV